MMVPAARETCQEPANRSGVKGDSRLSEAEQIVSKDAVRAELGRILASPGFDASERNRRFLAHVVEEALATSASTRRSIPSSASRPAACAARSNAST